MYGCSGVRALRTNTLDTIGLLVSLRVYPLKPSKVIGCHCCCHPSVRRGRAKAVVLSCRSLQKIVVILCACPKQPSNQPLGRLSRVVSLLGQKEKSGSRKLPIYLFALYYASLRNKPSTHGRERETDRVRHKSQIME